MSEENHLTHDEEFWFDDGSILLVAGGTAFKVHSSVLAKGSVVFRDMFTASRAVPGEYIAGCTAVPLQDSPDGLRCLLQVMYGGSRSRHSDLTPVPFKEREILLRIARKYQMEEMFAACLKRLKSVSTDKLEVWRSLDKPEATQVTSASLTVELSDGPAVRLARDIQELTLLPIALYLCCRLAVASTPSDTLANLPHDDLHRCFVWMCRLTLEILRLSAAAQPSFSTCRHNHHCQQCSDHLTEKHPVPRIPPDIHP